jgi:DNA-binding transcriptional regulator YiaG
VRCIGCGRTLDCQRGWYQVASEDGCTACGDEIIAPPSKELRRIIANGLAEKTERLLPEEIRFLRNWLGLSSVGMARRMGVRPETVSRWERRDNPRPMELSSERFLRLMVACAALHQRLTLDLDAIGSEPPASRPRVVVSSPHRSETNPPLAAWVR